MAIHINNERLNEYSVQNEEQSGGGPRYMNREAINSERGARVEVMVT